MIRRSLFISSSNKKKCRVVFLILAMIAFFLLGVKILNYLYWQEDALRRILWHNFYQQAENIEYAYMGSCHVYQNLNPEILDEKNGKNNYNLSTAHQHIIESYYLLKEADRKNKIEKVYLELYYILSTGEEGKSKNKGTILNAWRNADYMKSSFNKIDMLFHMNPVKYYPEAAFPFLRYRDHLMDGAWIQTRTNAKATENYKKYIYKEGDKEYRNNGYLYITSELTNLFFERGRNPAEMLLTEDAEAYLRKIITYCQDKDIEITLFTSPMYELHPMSTENYDCYADNIKEIAAEYGVPYYDFNMLKEEYLPIQNPKYFDSIERLNAKGAELYTNFFHQVVSAPPEENKKYFYDSYREKLENSEARVLGLYYYAAGEDELSEGEEIGNTIRMVIAAYRETELEYQIFLTPENEETMLLQDFSTNKKFNVPAEEHGVCKIVWRSKKEGKVMGSMKVLY